MNWSRRLADAARLADGPDLAEPRRARARCWRYALLLGRVDLARSACPTTPSRSSSGCGWRTVAWNIEAEPRQHLQFLRDWWPPVLALVVYFYSRGLADNLHAGDVVGP